MPCADQDVVPEQMVGHSFGLSVCLPVCLFLCVIPNLMPCGDQDVIPEQKVGHSFGLSVCCFLFNALLCAGQDMVPE